MTRKDTLLYVSKETREKVRQYKEKTGLPIKWIVSRAIEEYLDRHSKEHKAK